ncbi:MAG: hypothetical protein AAFX55_09095 [Bacteroidota bacterium]
MSDENNLWNPLEFESVTTPKAILSEQASYLTKMTKNVLRARIRAGTNPKNLVFNFEIIAPSLNNYVLVVCSVSHDLVKWYPLTLVSHPSGEIIKCEDEAEFINKLKEELNRKDVIEAIKSLFAQSRS